MLLIGSHAMRHWFPTDFTRPSRDRDYIATIDEYETFCRTHKDRIASAMPTAKNGFVVHMKNGNIFEFSIAWEGTTNEELLRRERGTASLETLLLLKLSHRYLRNSPHFHKTMADIHYLREKGVHLTPDMQELLKRREAETYYYVHPKLNQSKDNFFTDSVGYVYDHDSIHEAVAVGDRPAYQFAKKDLAEVQMSRKKFAKLPPEVQLLMPLEESYVLAIERSLVPYPGVLTPEQAFNKALMKVCTSITSGWFREFSWENYHKVVALYDDSYYGKFQAALAAGKILPFQRLAA